MLSKYIFLNLGRIIIEAILTLFIVFLCIYIPSKIFAFAVDYRSFYAGAGGMLIVLEVVAYRKWLRLDE